MERLTNRDKEIPLPNADNALFWARVHEKLARYEDAEEHTYFASKPQTNADRIRAMTDEELAESRMLCPYYDSEEDMCSKWFRDNGERDCAACALDWLKKEESE